MAPDDFVRSIRGDARPGGMCVACGTLLEPDTRCVHHPDEPPGGLDGAWHHIERAHAHRPRSDSATVVGAMGVILGLLTLAGTPFFQQPMVGLGVGMALLTGSVFLLGWPRSRLELRWPRRVPAPQPKAKPVAGVVQRLVEGDAWIAYQITAEPIASITATDGWTEEALLELEDGRSVVVPAGPARILGGGTRTLDRETMDLIRAVWMERAGIPPSPPMGTGGGMARVLSHGDPVLLYSEIRETDGADAYRSGARWVALPPIVIAKRTD